MSKKVGNRNYIMPEADSIKTHYRTCHLCEAMCGLEIRTRGDKVLSIKGDEQDVYSQGHICILTGNLESEGGGRLPGRPSISCAC